MKNDLYLLLKELIIEFSTKTNEFLQDPRLSRVFKKGNYASKGADVISGNYTIHDYVYFDLNILCNTVGYIIKDFKSTRKIFDYLTDNKLWHEEYLSFEESMDWVPSVTTMVAGGFISRNFEINNKFEINDISFNIAYQELISFLTKNYVEHNIYISIEGVTGEIPIIDINDSVSIIKANFEIAKIFSINYSRPDFHHVKFFEGDYLIKINVQIPKEYYNKTNIGKANSLEKSIIERWSILPILGIPNYLKVSKRIVLSDDWAINYIRAPGPFGNERSYRNKGKMLSITESTVNNFLRKAARVIDATTDFKSIDKKILYSIERLTKSKSAFNIDDRVVELSLAFEYLINTSNNDVTLQLCLKIIKLVDENNNDDSIFDKLKKFYTLRSKIIHGNDKIALTETTKEIVDFTEAVIQKAIIRLIELNHKYSYKKIDRALIKSLHITKKLSEILEEVN